MIVRPAIVCAVTMFSMMPVAGVAQTINGAGGTFAAPLYMKWAEAAKAALGLNVAYDASGPGDGVERITKRTVDFGASDTPLSPDELAAADLVQFPTVIGAVVLTVNLPRLRDAQLRLTGEALADIYAGRITKWNDARLIELNPAVTMPNIPIIPVHRYEVSGTSGVFTAYLSAVSPAWKAGPGTGGSIAWPTGPAARGNDGMASTVLNMRGAIGYIESSFATQNHLPTARLRNQSGLFVKSDIASFAAAVSSGNWAVQGFAANLIDTPGAANWPIVTATFVLLPRHPADPSCAAAVEKFFDWAYHDGRAIAQQLSFIPLPAGVQEGVRASWQPGQ